MLTGGPKRSHDKNPSLAAYGGDSNFNFGNYRNCSGQNGGVEKTNFTYGDTWGGLRKTRKQSIRVERLVNDILVGTIVD